MGRPIRRKRLETSLIIIIIVLAAWGLIILFPFYNALLLSLTPREVYVRNPFLLLPKAISLDSYRALLNNSGILIGFKTTSLILLSGVPLNMFLTASMGFCLSRNSFPGKRLVFFLVIATMFFNGGIIPLYITVKNLGLMDSLFSVILVTAANTFYLILTKNYFESIPPSMEESASIDGANDIVIFTRIYLPLAKPILATILLFYAVDRWNEWYHSMLFLQRLDLVPLQVILRNIVNATSQTVVEVDTGRRLFADGIKMAAVVVTMLPVMVIYPSLQRYFMKGIMLGAVKA